jgi:mannan endo-1,4-beta-mannosidase
MPRPARRGSLRFLPLSVAFLAAGAVAASAHPRGITTAADLVDYLRSICGRHTISGQYVECGDLAPVKAIHDQTGKWLGLISGDYYHYDQKGGVPVTTFNASAIGYWQAGGLVLLNLHMSNPTTGGPVYDVSRLDAAGLLVPGTPTHLALMKSLAGVAAGIRELQSAGVVVILRPFHENGGNWFWWGTRFLDRGQMVGLWRFTHDYLARTEGLHNLVWLFESGQPDIPPTVNYPGDAYADLVGQDVYTSRPGGDPVVRAYDTLVATGKPVCMAEFGPKGPSGGDRAFAETTLVDALKARMPQTVFFVNWWDQNAGHVGWGMASTREVKAALSDPWIVNREDIAFERPAP